jgi:BarA-like signal transduction histidine kinase
MEKMQSTQVQAHDDVFVTPINGIIDNKHVDQDKEVGSCHSCLSKPLTMIRPLPLVRVSLSIWMKRLIRSCFG